MGFRASARAGFTLVEVAVAIALAGIGVAATIGALTKVNSFASSARTIVARFEDGAADQPGARSTA